MQKNLKLLRNSFFLPVGWLIISTGLLIIPGSAFPKENWLDKIWFDKWVHIGMFAIMVTLWCYAWRNKNREHLSAKLRTGFAMISLACLAYGTGMEFVQHYLIPYRGFDVGDIVADGIGCLLGQVYSSSRYIKK